MRTTSSKLISLLASATFLFGCEQKIPQARIPKYVNGKIISIHYTIDQNKTYHLDFYLVEDNKNNGGHECEVLYSNNCPEVAEKIYSGAQVQLDMSKIKIEDNRWYLSSVDSIYYVFPEDGEN